MEKWVLAYLDQCISYEWRHKGVNYITEQYGYGELRCRPGKMTHAQNVLWPCNVIINKVMFDKVFKKSVPADVARPPVLNVSCVRVHMTLDFGENGFEVRGALVLFQSLARLPE